MEAFPRVRLFGYALGLTGLGSLYILLIRPRHQRWGATAHEAAAHMPGDELVPDPNWNVTRAISIAAPPRAVWPWLVQMGYQRGGLYSYDRLDRIFGVLDRPSADTVIPQFQSLAAGDTIPIGHDAGWPVAAVEPERLLVLDIRRPRLHITWSFVLTWMANGDTRLVLRYRGRAEPRLIDLPLYAFLDVAEFIMTRKMLLGIKMRAERLARRRLIPSIGR